MATKIDAPTKTCREDAHDEAFFRSAALRALTELPDLQAVLLFGSRARGTASSGSDWDLALIANSDCERDPREIIRAASTMDLGQSGVEMLVLSENELRAKRNAAGSMVRTILLTSRLLAGHMPDVGEIEAVARMDALTFENRVRAVCQKFIVVASVFAEALSGTDPVDIVQGEGREFVAATADAAEHLAKLMIDRRDVTFANTHSLNALADDLERDGGGRWSDTVRKIRDMNGGTRSHHQASYPENAAPESEDMLHAVRRIGLVASYLVDECRDVADDSSDLELAASGRWALEYLSRKAANAADLLRNRVPAGQDGLEPFDEYAVSADALLLGYETLCDVFNRLAAVRPD